MKRKAPLTVAIITHRSDSRFVSALRSSQIAENVIIMDNNSNNDWKELRKQYDFKLISHENKITNFAEVRNQVLSEVKTDWVFFLDSDETLGITPENLEDNQNKIEAVIASNLFDGVTIIRRDIFLNKSLMFGEAGNTNIVRMFKVKNGKFKRNVHEVAKITGKLGGSEIIVSHFSHSNISEFLKTIAEYSEMSSRIENPSKLDNFLKMIFYPPLKFVQNYFFKLGFLDGYRGIIYAILMSLHSLFVRVYFFEHNFKENNNDF